ncbi:MAG: flavodoxin domain-containing protein [Chitinophagaceae bacterium]
MKGIIIYKGKYGATEQYAKWLSDELELPMASADKINGNQLKRFDFFILGTSVYIGKLQLSSWLKKNFAHLEGKKIFFYQVAATPPEQTQKRESYNRSGIPSQLALKFTCYFLAGKCIGRDLSWKDRFLLKMGARLAKDPADKKNMLTDFDHVNKKNIAELLSDIKIYLKKIDSSYPATAIYSPFAFLF